MAAPPTPPHPNQRAEKERHANAPGASPIVHDEDEENAYGRHYSQVLRQVHEGRVCVWVGGGGVGGA